MTCHGDGGGGPGALQTCVECRRAAQETPHARHSATALRWSVYGRDRGERCRIRRALGLLQFRVFTPGSSPPYHHRSTALPYHAHRCISITAVSPPYHTVSHGITAPPYHRPPLYQYHRRITAVSVSPPYHRRITPYHHRITPYYSVSPPHGPGNPLDEPRPPHQSLLSGGQDQSGLDMTVNGPDGRTRAKTRRLLSTERQGHDTREPDGCRGGPSQERRACCRIACLKCRRAARSMCKPDVLLSNG